MGKKTTVARHRDRPTLAHVRALDDDQIVRDLATLGVQIDRSAFTGTAAPFRSAEDLTKWLVENKPVGVDGWQQERLWLDLVVLWERWSPDRPCSEMINDWMSDGYDAMRRNQPASVIADLWLRAWRAIADMVRERGYETVEEVDDAVGGLQGFINWCQDIDDVLHNAGLDEPRFNEEGLRYCDEFLTLFPTASGLLRENKRRAMAEFHVSLGRRDVSDQLFRDWLGADPAWGWGWIGWSDTHFLFAPKGQRDAARGEAILREGLAIEVLRDRPDVLDRLADLLSETGRNEESEEVRQQSRVATRSQASIGATSRPADVGSWVPVGADGTARSNKVGRNEPCPCGSGKKYKKCCGR